jgi:Protein of unknown function (DUF4231)
MSSDAYTSWLRTELGALIEELDLDEPEKRYLRSRWLDQLVWLEAKAGDAQRKYYGLRVVAIVGGLVVPALVSLNVGSDVAAWVTWATFALSLIVAIAVAIEGFFHYGERWRHYRRTAELMKAQGWQFYELAGAYERQPSHRAAFKMFAATIEGALAEDVDVYIREVVYERPPDPDRAG